MAELWLVRHGQTDWNVLGIYQGQSDVPLNETGREQSRDLAQKLAGQRFEAIYSSDLKRARETARIIAACYDLPVNLDARLREINQGQWEGQPVKDVAQRYRERLAGVHPQDARAPGGESAGEVAARMAEAASGMARAHPAGPVLVVSHGLAIALLYCQALGISLSEAYEHIPDNGTPLVIEWELPLL